MEVRIIIGADPYTYEDYINAINLNEEFDVNEQSVRDGSSLLQEAISVKKWDIAMDLIQRGINVNIQDKHGNTALHYLCSKPECIQLAEKILEAGGNPNIYNDANMTPLYSMVADMNGNYINSGEKYAIPTREDWEELESQLNCKFPETFKAFIELMSEYLFPGDIYNVLKENNNGNDTILYVYKYETKYSEWDKNMIPFWGIGNGDYFCICKTNNKIYYFYHDRLSFEDYSENMDKWIMELPDFLE